MFALLERQSDGKLSFLLFIAAGFWGLYWVPLRLIESYGLTDAWSVTFFNACPLIFLLPYLIWIGRSLLPNLYPLALISCFVGLGLSFYAIGLVTSTVVRATILFYLTPVWSTLIGVIWLSERMGAGRVVAILLGFGGLFCLLSGNDSTTLPLNVGDALALLSGMFWGLGAACVKRWPVVPAAASTTMMLFVTTIVSLGLGFLLFPDPFPTGNALLRAFPVAFPASVLILVPSAVFILWASRRLFPGRVGLLMMSEVLVAILSASLLLPEERMTLIQWVGVAGILAACLAEVLFSPRQHRQDSGSGFDSPQS